jgi:alcohol dehydrogenase (NADP+)
MVKSADFRTMRILLRQGAGQVPALGFGTLIADPTVTLSATRDALDAGFRHFDCAERYRNERQVGEALRARFDAGGVSRKDVFMTTKLWNTNHRPERVQPASRPALTGWESTISISTSCTHRSHSSRGTSRTRATPQGMSSMTKG